MKPLHRIAAVFLTVAMLLGISAATAPEADAGYGSKDWGEAAVDCVSYSWNQGKVSCAGWVDDTKTDGYCVRIWYRLLGSSSWKLAAKSCGATKWFSFTLPVGDFPYSQWRVTRGGSGGAKLWIYEPTQFQ